MIRALRVPLIVVTLELLAVLPAHATNGSLKVTSFPGGAKVFVDGADTGKITPMSVTVSIGTHVVKVQIPGSGWAPAESTATIVEGNNDLSVTLLPALTQGPEGPTGPQGPQGDPGIQGPPGTVTHAAPPCFDNTNRYVDCGNGTVTDTVTGLIWLQNANCFGLKKYAAANQAAADLADGQCDLTDGSSAGDWRLPTKAEWEATIARAVALGCVFGAPAPKGPPSLTNDPGTACLSEGPTSFAGVQSSYYWSSSANEVTPNYAWFVNLDNADVFNAVRANVTFVWPVRGGR